MKHKMASESVRKDRVRQGVAANQTNMRYYPYSSIPSERFAGTKTERIAVQEQARRQSKTGRSFDSIKGAARNALKKKMHKRPRGVSEDYKKIYDRKSQEAQVGGGMRKKY